MDLGSGIGFGCVERMKTGGTQAGVFQTVPWEGRARTTPEPQVTNCFPKTGRNTNFQVEANRARSGVGKWRQKEDEIETARSGGASG